MNGTDPGPASGSTSRATSTTPTPATVVWVIVHDLGRTGVPVALDRMVRWLAARPDGSGVELHVVAMHDGPLATELETSVASVVALEPPAARSRAQTLSLVLAELGRPTAGTALLHARWRRRTRHLPVPDVILLHGAGAWPAWRALEPVLPPDTTLVVHLHELHEAMARCIPDGALGPLLRRARRVMAVSEPVARMAEASGAAPGSVHLVPGTCDDLPIAPPRPQGDDSGAPTVIGIGEAGWRKGTDRFVAVAHELGRTHPHVRCRWIGTPPRETWRTGVHLPVTWQGTSSEPWGTVDATSTILLVPSREDPLPLVALEAGLRAVPVVATASGGLDGLLASDRGVLVDGHDLRALATAVGLCLDHPAEARGRAERLRSHVEANFRPDVVGPLWLAAVLGPTASDVVFRGDEPAS